ncbi:hypothetical protein ACNKHK_15140 [Shigella flexneri]
MQKNPLCPGASSDRFFREQQDDVEQRVTLGDWLVLMVLTA